MTKVAVDFEKNSKGNSKIPFEKLLSEIYIKKKPIIGWKS